MEDFYREQRRRFDVLMDGDKPVGNRWNYDEENRESPPKKQATLEVPKPYQPREDDVDEKVRHDLDRMELPLAVGNDGPRLFAVTPTEAKRALDRFIEHRLPTFGRYEDAIMGQDWAMSHSLLSVPLNLGVLHPLDAVEAAEDAYRQHGAPLAAVEGFIRQILGWREYMWHLYWHFGPSYTRNNKLAARTALPQWWRELDADSVTAECLRHALIGRARPWLDPPHPAAHGARQPRAAARLSARRADGVVRHRLRRRLQLGDADQRRRDEPARRRRQAGHQAVRLGRRLHQQDERPLRRLRLRPEEATRRRRLPVHCRLLVVRAPAPGSSGARTTARSAPSRRWNGSNISTRCSNRSRRAAASD